MNRLQDKVCLITGASSGIGAKAAEVFAREGAKVVIAARRGELLDAVAAKISEKGGEATAVVTDIRDKAAVDKLVALCMEKYGRIDVLVNNAGIANFDFRPVDSHEADELEDLLSTNVKGTMYVTRLVTEIFTKQKSGNVVMVASSAAIVGNGSASYVATKGALVSLSKHIALRYADREPNIRSNCLCPGTVWTDITKGFLAKEPSYGEASREFNAVLGKHSCLEVGISKTVDAANILLFLASDESAGLNGQCLVMDKGATL